MQFLLLNTWRRHSSMLKLKILQISHIHKVGSLYHKDRMAGRKLGAALITANISQVLIFRTEKHENKCYLNLTPNEQHILEHFTSKAGNYRPLVYCWRGGQRSRSMALILRWTQHCIVRKKILPRLYVSSTTSCHLS